MKVSISNQLNLKMARRGREVIVLDTRNDYELRVGTFENAVDLDIKSFRDFPNAVEELEYDKSTPVVMFCTGGIRCEKASMVMERRLGRGLSNQRRSIRILQSNWRLSLEWRLLRI